MQYLAILISALVATFSVIAEAGLVPELQTQASRPVLWAIAVLPLAGALVASSVIGNEARRKKAESRQRDEELRERRDQVARLEDRNRRDDAEKLYLIRTINTLESQLGSIVEALNIQNKIDEAVRREQEERRARIEEKYGSAFGSGTLRFQIDELSEAEEQADRTTEKAKRILDALHDDDLSGT